MLPPDSIKVLQRNITDGGERAFDIVPKALLNVIEGKQWEQCADRHGRPFASFEAFVKHELWEGLESTIDDLKAFCRKRPDVQEKINEAVGPAPAHVGKGHSSDNVSPNHGNNPTYILRRLKRDRPDLAEQVIHGQLSAHAAAIAAGFRKKATPLDQLRSAWAKASLDERATFIDEVT